MHQLIQPEGWERPKGYANGIAARGTQIYVGGMVGWNAQQQFESDDFLQQTGQALRALRAEAEAKAVRLDEVAAIDRLRAAQSLARELTQQGKLDLGGQQEASIIDARLRALEAKRRELLQPNK